MTNIDVERLALVKGFKVVFPPLVTQSALLEWQQRITQAAKAVQFTDYCLLLDSNTHNFESIQCLKLLRDILQDLASASIPVTVVAFFRPKEYGGTIIVSDQQA